MYLFIASGNQAGFTRYVHSIEGMDFFGETAAILILLIQIAVMGCSRGRLVGICPTTLPIIVI